jgi:hypothetical protein
VLAHFSGTDDPVDDLVQVLRINHHSVVMMDRDGNTETDVLNAHKGRILQELGPDSCWVTQGREVENYLRPELVRGYLSDRYGREVTVAFEADADFADVIDKATAGLSGPRVRYAKEKVRYAREFAKLMTKPGFPR